MDRTLRVQDSDLILQLREEEGDSISNFNAQRESGQTVRITVVNDVSPTGKQFRAPMFFEHDKGDKVGDIVITLRQDPKTKRYMVQVEEENIFVTEIDVAKMWRATRSGIDNPAQAIKKTVAHTGWIYSNPRRIGGKPIKVHFVIAGWSPQVAQNMMDVYDYVQTLDAMGLAALLKALQHMPDRPANEIFKQLRTPSAEIDS